MTPTEFDFRVQMPGDARLVGAIRQLAAQAAGYANLDAESSEELASAVERATADAVGTATPVNGHIELHFCGDAEAIVVTVSWMAHAAPQRRQIRQRVTA